MAPPDLHQTFRQVRRRTLELCAPLEPEDTVIQSMPDVSPTRWHLAHTTWFFERFVLQEALADYEPVDPAFFYLFNSYYQTVGPMHARPERGLLSRPTLAGILDYRAEIERRLEPLLQGLEEGASLAAVATLGLHHEQQHQELILTDIKHVFSCNPLRPAYRAELGESRQDGAEAAPVLSWTAHPGGTVEVGHAGAGFAFDNETPRHAVLLQPFQLADRLTTCGEYRAFVEDGGYERPDLWLSDGWEIVQREGWRAPLYWEPEGEPDARFERLFTLAGVQPLRADEPVCHVSYYEADAYARWAGARLPREEEWEAVASVRPVAGNLQERGRFHPARLAAGEPGPAQLFGDAWEWTASPYAPYPRYKPLQGALGEYNGKFMCNQMVLRGGSCATPAEHLRATYRNFFYPHSRWQFSGIRLARDTAS